MNKFDKISSAGRLILKGDDRIEKYREDTMMRGDPDAVLLARDEKDVKDAIEFCTKNFIPITFCGSQTSMTGSSVAENGLLVCTEKLEGIKDIYSKNGVAYAASRSGTITADFQKGVEAAGFFYPVGPTSRDECRIASNVATNASGEDSFKYGHARNYVQSIRAFMADGSEKIFERTQNEIAPSTHNMGGYFTGWKNPIDLIIGSEGTLVFISETTVRLLPKSPDFFSVLIPFPSIKMGLEYLINQAKNRTKSLRALEFADLGAITAMKTADGFPPMPYDLQSLVYLKIEYEDAKEDALNVLFASLENILPQNYIDSVLIAQTPKQKEEFRLWRHCVPEWANEEGRKYVAGGGGKVGSDWWVPIEKLSQMMEFFYKEMESLKLPSMAYAHLGSGHPHTNILAKNSEELKKAKETLIRSCKEAVRLGGAVAGEHGIGKIHRDLMSIQHSSALIEKMKRWKKEYDPNWILGRGNIL